MFNNYMKTASEEYNTLHLAYINIPVEFRHSYSTTQPGQTHTQTSSQQPFPATLPSVAAEIRT